MLCLEDNKEYTCGLKDLKREVGLGITDDDLTPGSQLVWYHRGTYYKAEVLKLQGILFNYKACELVM